MSWPRASLYCALLMLAAPWVSADTITVNTTTDDNADNSLCSLREAVEYFNKGSPKHGYQGCLAPYSDSFNIITLPENNQPYLIGAPSAGLGAIKIRSSLTINGAGVKGDSVTTVKVAGPNRAFIINLNPVFDVSPCTVSSPCQTTNSPDLDAGSDSGSRDYVTTVHSPYINGTVPMPVGGYPAAGDSYLVQIYEKPAADDPVPIGSAIIPITDHNTPVDWQLKVNRSLPDGVHHLVFTTQLQAGGSNVGNESPQSDELKFAVYTLPGRLSVTLNQLVIEGGDSQDPATTLCASVTACASDEDGSAIINDPAQATTYDPYSLSFRNVLSGSAGNGGVIFSNEELILTDVVLKHGLAVTGGGIYLSAEGGLQGDDSELSENTASNGAALYAENNAVNLQRSLITGNTVTGTSGTEAVVTVAGSAVLVNRASSSSFINVTMSGNDGTALFLSDDMTVNGSTIVLNKGGIYFNGVASVYNSILAGNPDYANTATPSANSPDCTGPQATAAVVQASIVLTTGGCPSGTAIANVLNTSGQLMATVDPVTQKCEGDYGLLCPLADHGGSTFVHMPRVLPTYTSLADSPIINQGSPTVGGYDADACPSEDQRGKARVAFACDIGAVEFQQVGSGATASSGGTISYGQTYTQSLADDLSDEELLPAVLCPVAPPADPAKVVAGSYRSDVPGCPWVEVGAQRGTVLFNTDGTYSYHPSYDFHGFDRFYIRVITTLSQLNSLQADQSRPVSAQIIVEPSTGIANSKLGGAVDGWSLLLLSVLGLKWRSRRYA